MRSVNAFSATSQYFLFPACTFRKKPKRFRRRRLKECILVEYTRAYRIISNEILEKNRRPGKHHPAQTVRTGDTRKTQKGNMTTTHATLLKAHVRTQTVFFNKKKA